MGENPSAFPSGDKAAHPTSTFDPGMSLRDYFAAHALVGLVPVFRESVRTLGDIQVATEGLAQYAYVLADAMLAQRQARSLSKDNGE